MGEGTDLHGIGFNETSIGLETALNDFAALDVDCAAAADAVRAIVTASVDLEVLVARGALAGSPDDQDIDGEPQGALDVIAGEMLTEALRAAPVAVLGSKGRQAPVILDDDAPVAVVMDPLSGSSQVDTNIPIGTIFSLLPATADLEGSVLQPGHRQIAAGFVIYGPQTCLVLTLGEGTDIYTLDRGEGVFIRTRASVQIAEESAEYAIDAANYRHWDKPVQAYVDGNVAGVGGPHGTNFEMRWIASLVAEAYRILIRGGIYLYPGDRRESFEKGGLHLSCEANPLAMLVEQAGGLATDGEDRILDIEPASLDQRVPFIFGSKSKVERVRAFHDGTLALGERSPLFGRRGLFRH